ncbi:hypothetical protein E1161_04885 [Saccharopolyspora aridisoli]|uniref:Uncharacterized protein n=1 Tax=Saccharopolyspora aridisoli TaxID=2530385 RepID=A0A4R4V044_9PSEU|nr:hypothetical protein [Saccharopolyspora aridisoli]TDC95512.1 hypothetical protein E1161_04885 [Saccharopolyspora aridisoli]
MLGYFSAGKRADDLVDRRWSTATCDWKFQLPPQWRVTARRTWSPTKMGRLLATSRKARNLFRIPRDAIGVM